MENDRYITVKEVMETLKCSEGKAYWFMRELNKELKNKGFLTMAGRVPRKYFEKRFGIEE